MTSDLSLSDIATVTNNDGFGGNGAWWIILFLIFGWGRGYGNNDSGAMNNYVLASDFATLQRQIDSGFNTQERRTDSIINGICDSAYTNAQLINGVQMSQMQNTNAIQAQLADCCCQNREAIAQVRYDMATQSCALQNTVQNSTRDITDNANANTRAILESLTSMKMEAKDERIAELTAQVNALQLSASQSAQTAYLVNELSPKAPIPAFTVPNPFAPYYSGGCCA